MGWYTKYSLPCCILKIVPSQRRASPSMSSDSDCDVPWSQRSMRESSPSVCALNLAWSVAGPRLMVARDLPCATRPRLRRSSHIIFWHWSPSQNFDRTPRIYSSSIITYEVRGDDNPIIITMFHSRLLVCYYVSSSCLPGLKSFVFSKLQ